ncbi:MAG: hypothetical protein JO250_08590 [Armatimonadetes bacterium]|nr:hypothetical protein [Armatimonadota bacterium]
MQKRTLTALALAGTLVAGLSGLARAQTPTTPTTPPAHHGILSRIFHKPAHPGTSPGMQPGTRPGLTPGTTRPGGTPFLGGIIGNKKTHVYHMPGDRGALPSAANRVYFRTEAQAIAAGYHRAGGSHARPGGAIHGHRGSLVPMGAR